VVSRLAASAGVALTDLDPEIRGGIVSRMACVADKFRLAHEVHDPQGGVRPDFLNSSAQGS